MKFSFWKWNNGLSKKIKVLKSEEDLIDEKNKDLIRKTKWIIIGFSLLWLISKLFKLAVLLLPLWIALGISDSTGYSLISLSQENFETQWYWTLGFIPWLFEFEILGIIKG